LSESPDWCKKDKWCAQSWVKPPASLDNALIEIWHAYD
jgi:hypothetical protein